MSTNSQLFTASGTFTAPATLLNGQVEVDVIGGAGLSGATVAFGGEVLATVPCAASAALTITVGVCGSSAGGGTGHHAGGAPGTSWNMTTGLPTGGGGSSSVASGATLLVEAGGGGGFGGSSASLPGGYGGSGDLVAGNGTTPIDTPSSAPGRGGHGANNATNGVGGAAGTNGSSGTAGANGASSGGAGGNALNSLGTGGGGGGGGGGYAGGGGGGGGAGSSGGGGGGGSSFAAASATGVTFQVSPTPGVDGSVTVTYTTADAPYAPVLVSPGDGTYDEIATSPQGTPFVFTYKPQTDSGTLAKWAFRRKLSSGSTYNYWTCTGAGAGNWTATSPVWNDVSYLTNVSGDDWTYVFPAAAWADGSTYNWSVATAESHYPSINEGPFPTDFTVIGQVAPVVTITAPTPGQSFTQQAVRVSWTSSFGAGLSEIGYQVKLYTAAQVAAPGFVAGLTPPIYDSGYVTSSSGSSFGIPAVGPNPPIVSGGVYYAYVQVTETGPVPSAWVGVDFTVDFDGPAQPTLTIVTDNDPATGAPRSTLTATTYLNALTTDDSSLESGDTGSYVATNATLSSDSSWAADGTYSLRATSTVSSGLVIVQTATGTSGYPCTPGESLTGMMTLRGITGHVTTGFLNFYNASGASVGQVSLGSITPVLGGSTLHGVVTAPAGAAFYSIGWEFSPTAVGETLNADDMAVFHASIASPTWSLGGFLNQATTTFEFQSSDDGVTWTDCRFGGSVAVPFWPASPMASVSDYEATPGVTRQYRVRCKGYNSIPIIDAVVPGAWSSVVSGATTTNGLVVIQNPLDPTTAVACTLASSWKPVIPEKMARYFPVGRNRGIKSTDGTKGIAGTVDLQVSTKADRDRLVSLLSGVETLLLQFPAEQYYISIDGDRTGTVTWETMGDKYGSFSQAALSVAYVEADVP